MHNGKSPGSMVQGHLIQPEPYVLPKGFKPNLKSRGGDCLLNPNWELVLQKRSLMTVEASNTTSKLAV